MLTGRFLRGLGQAARSPAGHAMLHTTRPAASMQAIVSVFGSNRPGLVADIAEVVYDYAGNAGVSKMARVGDFFSVILLADIDAEGDDSVAALSMLHSAINRKLGETGRRDQLHVAVHLNNRASPDPVKLASITVTGQNSPGIVKEVTGALASSNFDILTADTKITSAPQTGEAIFELQLVAAVPVPEVDDRIAGFDEDQAFANGHESLDRKLFQVETRFQDLSIDYQPPDLPLG